MEEKLPSTVTDFGTVTENNLLLKIWTAPQDTLSFILEKCPDKHLTPLLILGGMVRALDRVVSQHAHDKGGTADGLMMGIVFGTLSGWLTYYCYAWGLSLTGNWLGGKATTDQLRTVLAWALIPSIASLVLLMPQVEILGDNSFRTEYASYFAEGSIVLLFCQLLQLVLSIWSVGILIRGIALVQGFGFGKSVLNMLLPGTLIIFFILLIASLLR
jgi:hypothetical protein